MTHTPLPSFRPAPFFQLLERKLLQTGPHLASENEPFSNLFFDLDPRATWASIWVHAWLHFGCFFGSEVSSEKKMQKFIPFLQKAQKISFDRPCELIGICNKICVLSVFRKRKAKLQKVAKMG